MVGEQQEIASRCLSCFVSKGFTSKQAVVEQCELIHSDDLALRQAKIPQKLVLNIYRTIHGMRKPPPSDVSLFNSKPFKYLLTLCDVMGENLLILVFRGRR